MTRKTAVLAVVALVVAGTSAALAAGAAPSATGDAALAQETTTAADGETTDDGNETTAEMDAEATTTAEGQPGADTASVIFLNQSAGFTFTEGVPNKTSVMVERAVVPEGGFVVIHEASNVSGDYASADNLTIGPVVGNSTYLEPGDHSNVAVVVDENVNESQTLVAMPHRDTNDNREYDFPEADDPYVTDGSPVTESAYIIVNYDVIDAEFGDEQTTTAETDGETTAANETTTEA
ncbi:MULTISPECIES: hypothetical protein [Halorussus]|uniref:DUF7282 domain-containing protein n=1 Tax=Halorussus TaxID=1070314 RepID=UPI000E218FE4|nr:MULTISPECIES: hypothetical protein [Halorussus]NHN58419.1 hypothetical protein [Halorussus sp. JP-T4]